ncbi:hypothetical protein COO60DRAFT_1646866 [Scenedesmus sp. NREL 46B-D3]|nr:hypothetical protein COO60DRAFT_1646866 [Scenedesmus sp. NREL 46B-D3]
MADKRIVAVFRHSVRQGSRHVDDPLLIKRAKRVAIQSANRFVDHVVGAGRPTRPFMIVTSPFQRCIHTAIYIAEQLEARGLDVAAINVATCLGEETDNVLRYFDARNPPKMMTDVMPRHRTAPVT